MKLQHKGVFKLVLIVKPESHFFITTPPALYLFLKMVVYFLTAAKRASAA